jgi:heptose I phosphotransferase
LTDQLALHEAIPLAQKQLDPRAFQRWKRSLIAELARLCRVLHDRNRFHKDLYLCHFYIASQDCKREPETWRDRVAMIDFHRLAHHPLTRGVWLVKDLGGLLYSSFTAGVTARDRAFFWHCYHGGRPRGWRQRLLAWLVRFKGQQYWRHNLKSQAKRTARTDSASRRPAA